MSLRKKLKIEFRPIKSSDAAVKDVCDQTEGFQLIGKDVLHFNFSDANHFNLEQDLGFAKAACRYFKVAGKESKMLEGHTMNYLKGSSHVIPRAESSKHLHDKAEQNFEALYEFVHSEIEAFYGPKPISESQAQLRFVPFS